MDKKATAYHEAGHVFTAIRLIVPFKYVTIIETGDALGHVRFNNNIVKILKKLEVEQASPNDRMNIEKNIIIDFAGYYAEKKYTGRKNNIGASQDWENAVTKADRFLGSKKMI